MEMNPYKPLIQYYEQFNEKRLSLKISLNKLFLKISTFKTAI